MVSILFGLLTAASYAYADFVGALAAKRVRAIAVTTGSFISGLPIAIFLALFVGAEFSPETVQAGILAGFCSALGVTCLYAALALGPISIVSPLTAVLSAIIPVAVDLSLGQQISELAGFAVALILIAVVLVAFVPGNAVRLPSLKSFVYSIGAGLGFSGMFVFLDQAPSTSGMGALIVLRVMGMILMFIALTVLWLRSGRETFIEKEIFTAKVLGLIFLTSLGDVTGNFFFLVAAREGSLAISAVLASLYPVGTILLARIVLKERIAISQSVGIALGLGAVALLALS